MIDLHQHIKVAQCGNDNDSAHNTVTRRPERPQMPNASTLSKKVTTAQCAWSHLMACQSNIQLSALARAQHWRTFAGLKHPKGERVLSIAMSLQFCFLCLLTHIFVLTTKVLSDLCLTQQILHSELAPLLRHRAASSGGPAARTDNNVPSAVPDLSVMQNRVPLRSITCEFCQIDSLGCVLSEAST